MYFVSEKNMDAFVNLPTEPGKLLIMCQALPLVFERGRTSDLTRNGGNRQGDVIVVILLRFTVRFAWIFSLKYSLYYVYLVLDRGVEHNFSY